MKKNKLINFFDLSMILILVTIIGSLIYAQYFYKAPVEKNIYVTVTTPAANIEKQAFETKQVYFNGVNRILDVKKVVRNGDNLQITLYGPGKIEQQHDTFNGQRILINQRVEIHGAYFAIGHVLSVSNELQ